MLKAMIVTGALVSSAVIAPIAGVAQHSAAQHRATQTQAGWITLYSLPYYGGVSVNVEPPTYCRDLPNTVGSAENESDQTVAFYPQSFCHGLPFIMEPGMKVPVFAQQPRSFGPYTLLRARHQTRQ